jgi:4-amino-4-deoxy-L-arabinose transferase-like glycosyltransferase
MIPSPALPSSPATARSWSLLVVIAACLFFVGLGRLPLLEPDEGRNAEIARETLVSGHWITPHFDTLTCLDKPAFFFWTVAASFKCFGISEWAARFPSALFALATVLLVWSMARRMSGREVGLYAGIILATSPLAFGFAHFVILDMPLTFFVALALFCFWIDAQGGFGNLGLDLVAFASMGVAALVKGPVGFLIPLITLLVYQALLGRLGQLKRIRWAAGCLIFFVITLPWFIVVSLHNPGFPKYAFWTESLLRFSTGAHMHRSAGPWYYIPVYFAGFFPWALFLFFAGLNRMKHWRSLWNEKRRAELFLITWVAVVFVFFSISHSKLPGYFLPALVPLSILMALAWDEVEGSGSGRPADWVTAGFASMILLGVLMAGLDVFYFQAIESRLAHKLPVSVLSQLRPGLLFGGIILAALGVLGRNMAVRRKIKMRFLAFAVIASTFPLLALRWSGFARSYFNVFSSQQLAQAILRSPERNLPIYGYYYFRTSLPFYLQRPVGLVTADGDETASNYIGAHFKSLRKKTLRFDSTRGNGPSAPRKIGRGQVNEPVLIESRQLKDLFRAAPGPFLVLVQNNEAGQLIGAFGSLAPLWAAWKYSVWERAISYQHSAVSNHVQQQKRIKLGIRFQGS